MFKKGDTVLYKQQEYVVITAVHHSAGELYYDIRFATGDERQTVKSHLSVVPTADDCDVWDAEAKKLAAAAKAKRKAANKAAAQAAAAETAAKEAEAAAKQAADTAAAKKAEKAAAMATVHHGIWCNQCRALPIVGPRWTKVGQDYDLCETCFWGLDDRYIERHRFCCLD